MSAEADTTTAPEPVVFEPLCSAYPQQGTASSTPRLSALHWNALGQIVAHGSIQVTIASPHHPAPPYVSAESIHARKPPVRPQHIVISDETESLPPLTDKAFPMWINKFLLGKLDDRIEEDLDALQACDTNHVTFHRPKSYTIKALASSPKGLGPSGSVMLALLDSSLAVTVYSFPDGTHQGAENRAIGLTARQIELQGPIPAVTHKTEVSKRLSNELQNRAAEVRTNCIAWSSAPVFQSLMGFAPEASLLALGNRAGGIQLWSVMDTEATKLWEAKLGDEWITDLVWSEWQATDENTCQAELTFTGPSTEVQSIQVKRVFSDNGEHLDLVVDAPRTLIQGDKRSPKGIKWIHGVLVVAKIGHVLVHNPQTGQNTKLLLQKVGNWTGCASSSPCSGISALPTDAALITLWSGESHVITCLKTDPQYNRESSRAASAAISDSVKILDHQIVGAQRAKQGGDLRFTQAFSDEHTLSLRGAEMAPGTNSKLLAIILEPNALHALNVVREGEAKHWVIIVDLSKALQGMFEEQENPMQPTATPATSLLSCLPEYYRKNFTSEMQVDTPLRPISSVERNPQVSSDPSVYHNILKRRFFETDQTRSDQAELIKKLWQTTFTGDKAAATNAIAYRNLEVMSAILDFFVQRISAAPDILATSASVVYLWTQSLSKDPRAHALEADLQFLTSLLPAKEDGNTKLPDCPICESSTIAELDTNGFSGRFRCDLWHSWKQCDLTLAMIEASTVRTCFTCRRQILKAPSVLEIVTLTDEILRLAVDCPWCGSHWV